MATETRYDSISDIPPDSVGWVVPVEKTAKCRICFLGDHTGLKCKDTSGSVHTIPSDLNSDVHIGFKVGTNGRQIYWMMIWHNMGNVTVYSADGKSSRWLSGDTEIEILFR